MKNKDIPILAFLNFLYLLVACVAAQLFAKLIIRFAVLFVELDFAAASVVRLIVLLAVSLGLFAFLGYKDGYRAAGFQKEEAIPAVGLAALAHLLLCAVFRFSRGWQDLRAIWRDFSRWAPPTTPPNASKKSPFGHFFWSPFLWRRSGRVPSFSLPISAHANASPIAQNLRAGTNKSDFKF